jgi:hypothetical protein
VSADEKPLGGAVAADAVERAAPAALPKLPVRASIYIDPDGSVHFGALFEGLVPVAEALRGKPAPAATPGIPAAGAPAAAAAARAEVWPSSGAAGTGPLVTPARPSPGLAVGGSGPAAVPARPAAAPGAGPDAAADPAGAAG